MSCLITYLKDLAFWLKLWTMTDKNMEYKIISLGAPLLKKFLLPLENLKRKPSRKKEKILLQKFKITDTSLNSKKMDFVVYSSSL